MIFEVAAQFLPCCPHVSYILLHFHMFLVQSLFLPIFHRLNPRVCWFNSHRLEIPQLVCPAEEPSLEAPVSMPSSLRVVASDRPTIFPEFMRSVWKLSEISLGFEGQHHLVGGKTTPLKKYEFVSWDDDIPNIWKNWKNV